MPRKKQNVGDNLETWVIKDVDSITRTSVRVYAAMHNKTMAQALHDLVYVGLGVLRFYPLDAVDPEVIARVIRQGTVEVADSFPNGFPFATMDEVNQRIAEMAQEQAAAARRQPVEKKEQKEQPGE